MVSSATPVRTFVCVCVIRATGKIKCRSSGPFCSRLGEVTLLPLPRPILTCHCAIGGSRRTTRWSCRSHIVRHTTPPSPPRSPADGASRVVESACCTSQHQGTGTSRTGESAAPVAPASARPHGVSESLAPGRAPASPPASPPRRACARTCARRSVIARPRALVPPAAPPPPADAGSNAQRGMLSASCFLPSPGRLPVAILSFPCFTLLTGPLSIGTSGCLLP